MSDNSKARRLWAHKTKMLTPYVPGEQPRDRTFIKLNTNENPYPPALPVLQVIRSFPADHVRLYPDPGSQKTRQALSAYYDLPETHIFVGNGSDEVLAIAFQAFFNSRAALGKTAVETGGFAPLDGTSGCSPAECIVFPDVTYSFYPVYAQMYDIPYRTIPLNADFSLPVAALREPSAGLVLANPNAPTGMAVGLDVLADLAGSDPDRLLIIDEAYVDFGAESAVALLKQFDNILVVQTCSKSRALAGLRIGYAMGAPELIEALERIRDSFNSYTLDSLAQAAATAAFAETEWFEKTRSRIIATREKTSAELLALGFQVLPSCANFLFVRHPACPGLELYQKLRQAGILVRHFRLPRIENFLRITIGNDDDMAQLIVALRSILSQPAT